MNKNITVNFTIPLSEEGWLGSSIIFYQWIPENDAIVITDDNKQIRVYCDKSCVSTLHELTDERIKSSINISVFKLKIDVILNKIENNLADFIYDERDSLREIHHGLNPKEDEFDILKNKYIQLGDCILKEAILVCNRLLSYARNIKGQYWLTEIKFEKNRLHDLNISFEAKAKINDGQWFKWRPPFPHQYITILNSNYDDYIKKNEWQDVAAFVKSNNRPNLTLELLANARYLFANGHMRSSVIEAVTALEVCVESFGKNPNIQMLSKLSPTERIDINNIGKQIEHLGLSSSIRFLIPLLIHENDLPSIVLEKCYKALNIRNDIVHKGQRNVASSLVREILDGVLFCCDVLNRYTKQIRPRNAIN